MLLGACWPYLDQRPAPPATWQVLAALDAEVVRVCSNAARSDLARLSAERPGLRFVVRAKLPKLRPDGQPYRTGDERPDLLDYREWPSEPSLRETLRFLLERGHQVDLELLNEPDLEWDEAASQDRSSWAKTAADCRAELERQVRALRTFRAETGQRFRLVLPALSEGWPERHEAWLAEWTSLATSVDAVAVHAYTNGRPFAERAWGGRPLDYAGLFGGLPLLVTETNDNGAGEQLRAVTMGVYLRWLEQECPAVEYACLFALPGQPATPGWWAFDADYAQVVRAALPAPVPAQVSAQFETQVPTQSEEVPGMPELVRGVDVSNYQGDIRPRLGAWLLDGISHVVVRLSTESEQHRRIAVEQLQAAQERGFGCSGYIWAYWGEDPASVVSEGLAVAIRAGVPLATVWLDAEDRPARGANVIGWLAAAAMTLEARGERPGIYTGKWWWDQFVPAAESELLAGYPLWYANYDADPSFAGWERQRFGGWAAPSGKQYRGGDEDLNVFLPEVCAPPAAGREAELARLRAQVGGLVGALAYVGDDLGDRLAARSVPKAERLAIAGELRRVREQFVGARP